MTNSVSSFLDTIRESRVLEPGRLEELLRTPDVKADGVDASMLGACLVQLGWLTEYQVGELLKGQGSTLLVGPYRLLERLCGAGVSDSSDSKFGPTFKASHPDRDGRFAVKLIAFAQGNGDAIRGRFLDEVRKAGRLAHPNIARVGEAETPDSRILYVREYVEGLDLASLVAQQGPLPVAYACDYIHQAAQALQHAHESGLVHGHLQASNLIVNNTASMIGAAPTSDGAQSASLPPVGSVVKMVDFGFSSLYPPESATPQRDLAALGKTFTFLLTGDIEGTLPGKVTVAVGRVIQQLLAETPGKQYASAADAVAALAPLCGNEPAPAQQPAAAMPALDLSTDTPPGAAMPPPPTATTATPAAAPPSRPPMPLPPPPPPSGTGPARFIPPPMAAPIATTPMADPVAEETPAPTEEPKAPTRGKRKWTRRDWMLVVVGLVLHLFAAVIIIILVMNYLNSQPSKGGAPKGGTIRQTAPKTKQKGPGMGSLKPAFDGREEPLRLDS